MNTNINDFFYSIDVFAHFFITFTVKFGER
jgi:hypothetical protein